MSKGNNGMFENGRAFSVVNGRKVDEDGFVCPSFSDPAQWCVSVRKNDDGVEVRSTRDPSLTTVSFDDDEWAAFVAGVKNGEFD